MKLLSLPLPSDAPNRFLHQFHRAKIEIFIQE